MCTDLSFEENSGAVSDPVPQVRASVRLALESRAESLIVVRAMIAGVADAAGIERARFDDLRTAVSEACSNVVLHAYDGEGGPMEVRLELDPVALQIRVLDRGRGIRQIISSRNRMRVGLALLSALADRAEVLGREGGGTEVRMSFPGVEAPTEPTGLTGPTEPTEPTEQIEPPEPPEPSEPFEPPPPWAPDQAALAAGDVVAEIAPVALVEEVVGRIAAALAVQASFTVDRHADVRIVCDELGALMRSTSGVSAVVCTARPGLRQLDLRLGPLPSGSWERFRSRQPGRSDTVLELLSDELRAVASGGRETLLIRLSDPRPSREDREAERALRTRR